MTSIAKQAVSEKSLDFGQRNFFNTEYHVLVIMHDKIRNMHLKKIWKGAVLQKKSQITKVKQVDFLSCLLVSLFPISKNMNVNKAMN